MKRIVIFSLIVFLILVPYNILSVHNQALADKDCNAACIRNPKYTSGSCKSYNWFTHSYCDRKKEVDIGDVGNCRDFRTGFLGMTRVYVTCCCKKKEIKIPKCTPNTMKCSQDDVYKCDIHGRWRLYDQCGPNEECKVIGKVPQCVRVTGSRVSRRFLNTRRMIAGVLTNIVNYIKKIFKLSSQ